MGACKQLWAGQDSSCTDYSTKYYQQLVLVNRNEVDDYLIQLSSVNIFGQFNCRHNVAFKLFEGKKGFRYTINENANLIYATAEKMERDNIVNYIHSVNVVVMGVDETTKCLLTQLDGSDYFAAVQHTDGTVEILGFEYGLTTSGYTYDPANSGGGTTIKLTSRAETPEDELPFIYRSILNKEVEDFDNNFENVEFDLNGDFNDDFNDDFNNEE